MHNANLQDEADSCRTTALRYLGRPEAPFLLRVAREFDRLAAQRKTNSCDEDLQALR